MKLSAHVTRLAAVLAALALALGAAACGDSDDESGGDGTSASTPATSTTGDQTTPSNRTTPDDQASAGGTDGGDGGDGNGDDGSPSGGDAPPASDGGSEEEQVAAVVEGMYRDFANADAAGVCAVMSDAVQKQIAENAAVEAVEQRTCTASLANFLGAAKRSGALAQARGAKVGKVEVDGDTATAVISLAGRSGKIRLVKENGEWHFGAAPLGGQTGS